jgi:hypothetical protein
MKKKLGLLLVLAIALTAVLTACGPKAKTEVTAWGYVHGGYVASATVKVDSSKTSGYSTEFHEYYLPQNWANWQPVGSPAGTANVRAPKVMIGEEVWDLDATNGTAANGFYKKDGKWLGNYVRDPKNAAWYGEQILAGKFWVLDASGNKVDDTTISTFNVKPLDATTALGKIDSLDKSKNGYWPGSATSPSGTNWNVQIGGLLARYCNDHGFEYRPKDITSAPGGGVSVVVNGYTITGATAVDSLDYLMLAQSAYRVLIG